MVGSRYIFKGEDYGILFNNNYNIYRYIAVTEVYRVGIVFIMLTINILGTFNIFSINLFLLSIYYVRYAFYILLN